MAFFGTEGDAIVSRIVFGYLSTVCPRFQELAICGPEEYRTFGQKEFSPICMRLDRGICLLARLTDLRRFRMRMSDLDIAIDRWDLDRMTGTDDLEELRRKEKGAKNCRKLELSAAQGKKDREDAPLAAARRWRNG